MYHFSFPIIYLFSHSCQVTPVRGDGFCFLNAIYLLLCCDYNEVATVNSLANSILGHLAANVYYNKWFHMGDFLQHAEGYFKFGNYCDCVIDLIIIATEKSTKHESVNLSDRGIAFLALLKITPVDAETCLCCYIVNLSMCMYMCMLLYIYSNSALQWTI